MHDIIGRAWHSQLSHPTPKLLHRQSGSTLSHLRHISKSSLNSSMDDDGYSEIRIDDSLAFIWWCWSWCLVSMDFALIERVYGSNLTSLTMLVAHAMPMVQ